MKSAQLLRLLLLVLLIGQTYSGPVLYGFCVAGCAGVCAEAAAIATAGAGMAAAPVCIQGCMQACLATGVLPTP